MKKGLCVLFLFPIILCSCSQKGMNKGDIYSVSGYSFNDVPDTQSVELSVSVTEDESHIGSSETVIFDDTVYEGIYLDDYRPKACEETYPRYAITGEEYSGLFTTDKSGKINSLSVSLLEEEEADEVKTEEECRSISDRYLSIITSDKAYQYSGLDFHDQRAEDEPGTYVFYYNTYVSGIKTSNQVTVSVDTRGMFCGFEHYQENVFEQKTVDISSVDEKLENRLTSLYGRINKEIRISKENQMLVRKDGHDCIFTEYGISILLEEGYEKDAYALLYVLE